MADDSSLAPGRLNQALSETSFLYGGNGAFVEDLYARWAENPEQVEPSWRAFFASLHEQAEDVKKAALPPPWTPPAGKIVRPEWLSAIDGVWPAVEAKLSVKISERQPALSSDAVRAATLDSLRAIMMIRAYRMRGHLAANLDPLGLAEKPDASELDPASYGFSEGDYDRPIFLDYVLGLETSTVREILAIVRRTYCGNVGVQFMHISDPDEKAWLQQRIEAATRRSSSPGRQDRHPEEADRERELRAVPGQALPRHQAVRAGRRRGLGPGAWSRSSSAAAAGRAGHCRRHAARGA